MCANPQSNTITVRASYILPFLRRFPWWKSRKTRGGGLSPLGKNQNRNHFVFLSFGGDPLNWQSSLKSMRWYVAQLPSTLADTLSAMFNFRRSYGLVLSRNVHQQHLVAWQGLLTVALFSWMTTNVNFPGYLFIYLFNN